MKIVKYMLYIVLFFSFAGCSSNDIDYVLARVAGNKPPQFFKFTSPSYVNQWRFEHKNFVALPPITKEEDWKKMDGWDGAYIYGGIAFGVGKHRAGTKGLMLGYGIVFSSFVAKYGKKEQALEEGNISYIRSKIRIGKNDKLRIEHHGKENYICRVMEYNKPKQWQKLISYRCYKFNPTRTKYKKVIIKLIYTKVPNLPAKYKHLAKQYTYNDLKRRAKRMLDSLHIKDGW
jgi:hypothetical protein